MAATTISPATRPATEGFTRNEKSRDTRHQNIIAARAVADAVRTSLGPRGMDKMIQDAKENVIITNDGATILNEMAVIHPAARMLVEMSKAQDIEAGDGTTSVVVIAGALLDAASQLLDRGVHAQTIAASFLLAADKAAEILQGMSSPVNLADNESLTRAAMTSLYSKVVSQNASLLAPMAVDAVLRITDITTATNVDLRDVRVVKKLGGTLEDTELVDGLVFTHQKVSRVAGGPAKIVNAKIGLIQFCLSPPKTDMENNITIKDYLAMDRLLKEERMLTAGLVKKIAKAGCNVLLVQKSILRDAVSDLSLDYLAKLGILVVRDIEREDVDFISRAVGCRPVASIDHFTPDRLGHAACVIDEAVEGGGRITRITGVKSKSTVTVLVRASNNLMLDEAERSLHDALCVVRSLVKTKAILPGGGAPEMEMSQKLYEWSRTLEGHQSLGVRAFSEALEVIPYTLAENAGLKPIEIVTELRNKHAAGMQKMGINVKKGSITDMETEKVIQPLLNSLSCIKLATETVMVILKIDDLGQSRPTDMWNVVFKPTKS